MFISRGIRLVIKAVIHNTFRDRLLDLRVPVYNTQTKHLQINILDGVEIDRGYGCHNDNHAQGDRHKQLDDVPRAVLELQLLNAFNCNGRALWRLRWWPAATTTATGSLLHRLRCFNR